ncbi:protein kinase [bacterium]|nr:protein kinase [bacterium]
MPADSVTDRPAALEYRKTPGASPIPGYVLIEPLGRGGFGEVWRCEAPGGLHKAVKFVAGGTGDAQLRQELEAFQQVKAIRHPYLLCLERVELVGSELVMVMGLADCQLGDRFQECRRAGRPGIPRDELLRYLHEAAEALDVIGTRHGLQHLDVKPANLFLTGGHVQVGDYGLVSKLDGGTANGMNRGLTPKYAAPEVLRGQVHTRSDQYSLALVYQELLTGTFPYTGRTPQQVMLQHVSAAPNLNGLPAQDRAVVATALAKNPEERHTSCRAFVSALMTALPPPSVRPSLITPQVKAALAGSHAGTPNPLLITPAPRLVTPASRSGVTGMGDTTTSASPGTTPAPPPPVPPPPPKPLRPNGVQLEEFLSILPVGWLRGREAAPPDLPPDDLVRAVVSAASPAEKPAPSGVVAADSWSCRFLSSIDPRVAKVKLNVLLDEGGLVHVDARAETRVVIKRLAPLPPQQSQLFSFGRKPPPPEPAGLEVVVTLPESGLAVGEVTAEARLFGSPPPAFLPEARAQVAAVLKGVREQLGNVPERRKHPRYAADFPVVVFPVHHDGRVETPLSGRCRDVSAGGLALTLGTAPTTKYAYVSFEDVRGTSGLAVLAQVIRSAREGNGVLVAGRYRLELWPPAHAPNDD